MSKPFNYNDFVAFSFYLYIMANSIILGIRILRGVAQLG